MICATTLVKVPRRYRRKVDIEERPKSDETVVRRLRRDHVAIDYYRTTVAGFRLSVNVFLRFRNTIFPSAVKGTVGKLSVRESRLTDKDIEKAKGSSNVIAW